MADYDRDADWNELDALLDDIESGEVGPEELTFEILQIPPNSLDDFDRNNLAIYLRDNENLSAVVRETGKVTYENLITIEGICEARSECIENGPDKESLKIILSGMIGASDVIRQVSIAVLNSLTSIYQADITFQLSAMLCDPETRDQLIHYLKMTVLLTEDDSMMGPSVEELLTELNILGSDGSNTVH